MQQPLTRPIIRCTYVVERAGLECVMHFFLAPDFCSNRTRIILLFFLSFPLLFSWTTSGRGEKCLCGWTLTSIPWKIGKKYRILSIHLREAFFPRSFFPKEGNSVRFINRLVSESLLVQLKNILLRAYNVCGRRYKVPTSYPG